MISEKIRVMAMRYLANPDRFRYGCVTECTIFVIQSEKEFEAQVIIEFKQYLFAHCSAKYMQEKHVHSFLNIKVT